MVFYYAGHGFKMRDKHMLPVNSPGPEDYLKKDSVSEGELLRDVLNTQPQVFLELLDMCLKSPEQDKNKAIFEEVTDFTPYSANSNLIQGYSTTSYLSAYERKNEKNGLFVKYLKQYLLMDASMVTILENVAKGELFLIFIKFIHKKNNFRHGKRNGKRMRQTKTVSWD